MKRVSTLCLTLLLGTSLVYSQQRPTSSPQEILDKMVAVYASCSSYVDKGQVKTTFFENSGPRTTKRPFSTAFVRPSRFRFEFEDRGIDDRARHFQDTHRIQTLTKLILRGEDQLGDRMAYWIEGRDWRNGLLAIWIDKESFLLLKIHEKNKLRDVVSESTTTYQPRINVKIAPAELAFNH
jgi:hypothetical protein